MCIKDWKELWNPKGRMPEGRLPEKRKKSSWIDL